MPGIFKMSLERNNMIGKKHGRLTVISLTRKNRRTWALCLCDCGNEKEIQAYSVKSGITTSCGCYRKEKSNIALTTHGLSHHPLLGVHNSIKSRCYNINCHEYKYYGERGIVMCNEWKNDRKAFYDWAILSGWRKGLQLDRVNNNGNYTPDNCRWVTSKVNCNNTRSNRLITHNGKTKTLMQWSEIIGINVQSLAKRLNRGWDIDKALFEPIKIKYRHRKTAA